MRRERGNGQVGRFHWSDVHCRLDVRRTAAPGVRLHARSGVAHVHKLLYIENAGLFLAAGSTLSLSKREASRFDASDNNSRFLNERRTTECRPKRMFCDDVAMRNDGAGRRFVECERYDWKSGEQYLQSARR
jgi:hypothetical protein